MLLAVAHILMSILQEILDRLSLLNIIVHSLMSLIRHGIRGPLNRLRLHARLSRLDGPHISILIGIIILQGRILSNMGNLMITITIRKLILDLFSMRKRRRISFLDRRLGRKDRIHSIWMQMLWRGVRMNSAPARIGSRWTLEAVRLCLLDCRQGWISSP